jgi:hypothetical protein
MTTTFFYNINNYYSISEKNRLKIRIDYNQTNNSITMELQHKENTVVETLHLNYLLLFDSINNFCNDYLSTLIILLDMILKHYNYYVDTNNKDYLTTINDPIKITDIIVKSIKKKFILSKLKIEKVL